MSGCRHVSAGDEAGRGVPGARPAAAEHCGPPVRDGGRREGPDGAAIPVRDAGDPNRRGPSDVRSAAGARAGAGGGPLGARRDHRLGAGAAQDPPGPPRGPRRDGGDGGKDDGEREGGLATVTRRKVSRPPRYKVLLFNDDYTPMEFVVQLLEQVFGKGPAEATQIMLAIHRGGVGVAGVYVLEVAETKVATVHQAAQERGYPLRAGVEKE